MKDNIDLGKSFEKFKTMILEKLVLPNKETHAERMAVVDATQAIRNYMLRKMQINWIDDKVADFLFDELGRATHSYLDESSQINKKELEEITEKN